MVEENPLNWEEEPAENYLYEHFLYRGVKKFLWATWPSLEKIFPTFFTVDQALKGLSVDWSKYSTPKDALNHLLGEKPSLTEWGMAQFNVGELREIIKRNNFLIKIKHDPIRIAIEKIKINRGHSLLKNFCKEGKKRIRTRIRVELSLIAKWVPNMKPLLKNEK